LAVNGCVAAFQAAAGQHVLMAGSKDHVLFPDIVSVLEGARKQSEA
jgi:hypothetical protein